ncbi:hypothetical protein fugu_019704 [Takifugu bimaculatus]|uniref:Uncharacterized protein n=1 Tax=Takifugu bimaculatus TaxID=433685 RepID=A0A4Z2BG40_9TELE|nr:hypothetical protein fugu_019704 [Takifugu bimaculatus]
MEREGSFRSLHSRFRLGSSSFSSQTDLSQAKSAGGGGDKGGITGGLADECSKDKGSQQRRAGANATWNSIHNAVISVFQQKELGENDLYTLNEGVRYHRRQFAQLLSWNLVESSSHAALLPEKQLLRSPNSSLRKVAVNKSAVVRSKSYTVPMLTPVVEHDADAGAGGGVSCVRRHSVSEMTSCLEESGAALESGTSAAETGSTSCLVQHSSGPTASGGHTDTVTSSQAPQPSEKCPHPVQSQHPSPCILPEPFPGEAMHSTGSLVSRVLTGGLSSGTSPPSSLENATDHVQESLDSDSEHNGIFLNFSGHCSGDSVDSRGSNR